MKLVLIGNFTEIYHEEGKARAFQKLGHDVYRFDEKVFDENDKNIIINQRSMRYQANSNGDITIFDNLYI